MLSNPVLGAGNRLGRPVCKAEEVGQAERFGERDGRPPLLLIVESNHNRPKKRSHPGLRIKKLRGQLFGNLT
jgi:hypothetical protein